MKTEAFERARSAYGTGAYDDATLEFVFPQLNESEDERIRKELIEFIKWSVDRHFMREDFHQAKRPSEWLTYLEKQKEEEGYEAIPIESTLEYKIGFKAGRDFEKQKEPKDKGEISDGYHTFNELYFYRMLYNAAFFNLLPKEWVHKSKKHRDGEECFGGGWFIVMANLPTGQISNHYELKDWDLFQIPEKEVADEWDGHTPQEAAERLHKYLLEKQKEQKPVENPFDANETMKMKDRIDEGFTKMMMQEQKPASTPERIRPKFAVGDTICHPMRCDHTVQEIYVRCADPVYICTNEEGLESHISFSEQNEWKRKEKKPVEPNWIHHKVDLSDCSEEYIKAYYDGWNNCNQQHAQHDAEQKPAEWSEEDEDKLEQCIRIVKGWEGDYDIVKSPYSNFLKSLRPVSKESLQSHWKPSEEQMEALEKTTRLANFGSDAKRRDALLSLYEQLKKLM